MFQKLTKTDGNPVWVNPHHIQSVTQPWGTGEYRMTLSMGASYDVKNTPELQALLSGTTAQAEEESPRVFAGITGPGLYRDVKGREVLIKRGDYSNLPWVQEGFPGRWYYPSGQAYEWAGHDIVELIKLEKE